MALLGIGKSKLEIVLRQNGKFYTCSTKGGIQIQREPNCPSKLTCTLKRDQITAERGDMISVVLDEQHQQFKGIIIDTSKSLREVQITAYDQLYYLKQCKIRYSYSDVTINELVLNLCKDGYGICSNPPHFVKSGYKLPATVEDNISVLDVITRAFETVYKYTGERYYIWDDFGNIVLWDDEHMANTTIKIMLDYLTEYSYDQTFEDYYNYIRVEEETTTESQEEGERKVYIAQNEEEVRKYGRFEYYQKLNEFENGDFVARHLLKEKVASPPTISLSNVQGDIRVRGGSNVFVDFFSEDRMEYIRGYFKVSSVTHTIEDGVHRMDLQGELIDMYDDWDDPLYGKKPDYTKDESFENTGFNNLLVPDQTGAEW